MKKVAAASEPPGTGAEPELPAKTFRLVLYVAGQTPQSRKAIENLNRLCETRIGGVCSIEIVDVTKDPARAVEDQVVALPTLVRRLPPPLKRIIGTLADEEKVLRGLELVPESNS